MIDMPGWLRVTLLIAVMLLIPAINVGERIYTKIEKAWCNRVRWFR